MTRWRTAPSPIGPPGSRLVFAEIEGLGPFVWQFYASEIADPRALEAKLAWMAETVAALERSVAGAPGSLFGAAA